MRHRDFNEKEAFEKKRTIGSHQNGYFTLREIVFAQRIHHTHLILFLTVFFQTGERIYFSLTHCMREYFCVCVCEKNYFFGISVIADARNPSSNSVVVSLSCSSSFLSFFIACVCVCVCVRATVCLVYFTLYSNKIR